MTFSEDLPKSLHAGIAMADNLIREGVQRLLDHWTIGFSPVDALPGEKPLDLYITDDLQKLSPFSADRPPIVLCADLRYRHEVVQALALGADACVSTTSNLQHLSLAIHHARLKRVYLCPTLSIVMCRTDVTPASTRLTPRESDVLEWLSRGYSSKEIARAIGISPSTVDTHRRSLMQKVGVHKAAELTRYALAREQDRAVTTTERACGPRS
ncbi:MAG: LuxR C-terminal-related transcriptional regulator [Rubrivivax sp.]|jgi:DNA-binding NarL/FixJ family response regulator